MVIGPWRIAPIPQNCIVTVEINMAEKRNTKLPVFTGEISIKAEMAVPIKDSLGAQKSDFGCV